MVRIRYRIVNLTCSKLSVACYHFFADNNYESEEETSLPGNTDDEEDNETDLTTGHGTDAAFDNEDKEGDCDSDVDVEEEVSPGGREQDDTDAEYLDQSLQGLLLDGHRHVVL